MRIKLISLLRDKNIGKFFWLLMFAGLYFGGFAALSVNAQIIISEFRFRGLNPNGATNEFIELYNNSGADHTVAASSGTGYAVAASDGIIRCTIPNGTVIPNRGHYLCANSVGYALSGYAAANATFTTDIPDNTGVAIFNTSITANFSLATRMDAVGFTSEANTLYKEGTGIATINPTFNIDHSFLRDNCGKGGSITDFNPCTTDSPIDTNNNAANFYFVDTNGTSAGAGQRLGIPGPENLASPIQRNASVSASLAYPCVSASAPPNRVRSTTPGSGATSSLGTISLRRIYTNNTGGAVTRLRFRIIDITTFPAPSGVADLRPITSSNVTVAAGDNPCGTGAITFLGTTLEQPPSQPNGSGFNGSFSAGTITLGAPLGNGQSVNLQFLLGLQQTGSFKFNVNVEALP